MKKHKEENMDNGTIKITQMGPYTIASIKDEETKKVGYGASRKSFLDKFNKELGENIATGRAKKSLMKKLQGERIRNIWMG